MHVLVSAYACSPHGVSEAAFGWGWATHLAARGLRIHVLTVGSQQAYIEAALAAGIWPNLSFSFVEPTGSGLRETSGKHYFQWQRTSLERARTLHANDSFDVVHHVTYGSIHVPTLLWKLGVPVVFGPVGGGQTAPLRMLPYFRGAVLKEIVRTVFTWLLPLSPFHRRSYGRIHCVLATNYETLALARRMGCYVPQLGLDTGLPDTFFAQRPRSFDDARPLRLLWTGRMMPRKGLALTLDGLAAAKAPVTLTILGDGIPAERMEAMLRERGIQNRVHWSRGRVPWAEVRQAYATHDAFLFTSLRESFGSQHLEAMALGLPVITLNLHGARAFIPEAAAIKVPVSDKASTVRALAGAIEEFAARSPRQRNAMSAACMAFASAYTWKLRAERAEALYERLIVRCATGAMPWTISSADLSPVP